MALRFDLFGLCTRRVEDASEEFPLSGTGQCKFDERWDGELTSDSMSLRFSSSVLGLLVAAADAVPLSRFSISCNPSECCDDLSWSKSIRLDKLTEICEASLSRLGRRRPRGCDAF